MTTNATTEMKQKLHTYLREAREAVLWKADGLDEYDLRRPLTRTGTSVLGLIKHLSLVEAWYFGDCFDRPFEPHLTGWDEGAEEESDMWATAEESSADLIATYRAAIAHADATIDALDLDAIGHVPWWRSDGVTLHSMLVHVLSETARHAGHVDILREGLDARAGMSEGNTNQGDHDDAWWAAHRVRIEAAARAAAGPKTP